MGKGLCKFKFSPSNIEYSSENKVKFGFLDFFMGTFFVNFYFA
jgi:hypothetical protein